MVCATFSWAVDELGIPATIHLGKIGHSISSTLLVLQEVLTAVPPHVCHKGVVLRAGLFTYMKFLL